MKVLTIAVRELRIAYLEWALREIDPLHADLPAIVCKLQRLREERATRPTWGWS